AASHDKPLSVYRQFALFQVAPVLSRRPYVQILAAKSCVGARPGLKTASAIYDLRRGTVKVDSTVLFFEQRRESCCRIVLRLWTNGSPLQPMQCLDHQFCADRSHAWSQSLSGLDYQGVRDRRKEFRHGRIYWSEGHIHPLAARSLRLSHYQLHPESHVHQPIQRRDGEMWSAAENKMDEVEHKRRY